MSDDDRARSVLRLYSSCAKSKESAKAVAMEHVDEGQYRDVMSAMRAQQDWKLSVHWVLQRVGLAGVTILVFRLMRQQKSQANSFATIAREVGLTKAEVELMFDVSLAIFIRELDNRGIADAFWIEEEPKLSPDIAPSPDLCAARALDLACPIQTAAA